MRVRFPWEFFLPEIADMAAVWGINLESENGFQVSQDAIKNRDAPGPVIPDFIASIPITKRLEIGLPFTETWTFWFDLSRVFGMPEKQKSR